MYKLHKTEKAKTDLLNIWDYSCAKFGEAQADKYLYELDEGLNLIILQPFIGVACDELRLGYRKCYINSHVVFYYINGDTIHVVRVLGENMDFERHL